MRRVGFNYIGVNRTNYRLSLVKRAEQCGCDALVITLDTTLLGWRTADLDLAYLPFLGGQRYSAIHVRTLYLTNYCGKPIIMPTTPVAPLKPRLTWRTLQTMLGLLWRYPQGSFLKNLQSGEALRAVRQFINIYSRPSLTWENLSFLRQHTRLPILLKGILQPLDAQKALDYGMDGIIISNHGGRQVDGAVSTIEMLPDIAQTIAGRIPIIIDSGIRGGADAFKALALGATAVGIGRPYCYALAIAGEQGVSELLANYRADFELTMGLAGCKNIAEINSSLLRSTRWKCRF